jgi:hypothetical protein
MEAPSETKICAACGRRFARADRVEAGRCPLCGGSLVELDQGRPHEGAPFRRDDDDVAENGNR